MRADLGRYFESHGMEIQRLLKALYDMGLGQGKDVVFFLEGRELVLARGEPKGYGFVRFLPEETGVTISFPSGAQLFDPAKRMRGFPGSRTRVTLRSLLDMDPYVRRLVDQAYAVARPAAAKPPKP